MLFNFTLTSQGLKAFARVKSGYPIRFNSCDCATRVWWMEGYSFTPRFYDVVLDEFFSVRFEAVIKLILGLLDLSYQRIRSF